MVTKLQLQRFRGFADATLELKPLTVLLGPNSSGKSSFGQAIAALAHAMWEHSGSNRLSLTPTPQKVDSWPVDLGTLEDLRYKHADDRPVIIGLQTREGWVRWGFGNNPSVESSQTLSLSYLEYPPSTPYIYQEDAIPSLSSPLAASGSIQTSLPSDSSQPASRTGSQEFMREDFTTWRELRTGDKVKLEIDGLSLNSQQHLAGTTAVPTNPLATKDFTAFLRDVTYLRATRQRPLRSYPVARSDQRQQLGYSGEFAASLLKSGINNEVSIVSPTSNETVRCSLAAGCDIWLDHLGLAYSARGMPTLKLGEDRIEISPMRGHIRDLTEVGFGISQVLPVIIGGLLQLPTGIFIVDLPEAHLHPRPQAALADFFCSLALEGKRCLVETHSEMFIHQLRLRVEEDERLASMIAVYFIDAASDRGCSTPRLIGLGQKDQLVWPAGFMQEGWELEIRINKARAAKRK